VALQRKLRALAAVLLDPVATDNERANARTLKLRLQQRLAQDTAATEGETWTGILFRLGRGVRQIKRIKQTTSPSSPKGDWTDNAYRLGRMFRNLKK
jgi:hypothetical protein